jgi:type II secretory pathway pseudopilin PulG
MENTENNNKVKYIIVLAIAILAALWLFVSVGQKINQNSSATDINNPNNPINKINNPVNPPQTIRTIPNVTKPPTILTVKVVKVTGQKIYYKQPTGTDKGDFITVLGATNIIKPIMTKGIASETKATLSEIKPDNTIVITLNSGGTSIERIVVLR